ncbi:hypothetical protein C8Q74DRAFT_1439272 [Fomes fomentarius]|nr:hypothetical protein C8Q74DRAFT_1439272 [Fomes fomentarius]
MALGASLTWQGAASLDGTASASESSHATGINRPATRKHSPCLVSVTQNTPGSRRSQQDICDAARLSSIRDAKPNCKKQLDSGLGPTIAADDQLTQLEFRRLRIGHINAVGGGPSHARGSAVLVQESTRVNLQVLYISGNKIQELLLKSRATVEARIVDHGVRDILDQCIAFIGLTLRQWPVTPDAVDRKRESEYWPNRLPIGLAAPNFDIRKRGGRKCESNYERRCTQHADGSCRPDGPRGRRSAFGRQKAKATEATIRVPPHRDRAARPPDGKMVSVGLTPSRDGERRDGRQLQALTVTFLCHHLDGGCILQGGRAAICRSTGRSEWLGLPVGQDAGGLEKEVEEVGRKIDPERVFANVSALQDKDMSGIVNAPSHRGRTDCWATSEGAELRVRSSIPLRRKREDIARLNFDARMTEAECDFCGLDAGKRLMCLPLTLTMALTLLALLGVGVNQKHEWR